MKRSESIKAIALALAKAQGEFENVLKSNNAKILTKSGKEYTYQYADLASLLEVVREPLSKNELALVQAGTTQEVEAINEENKKVIKYEIVITTLLAHSSGEYFENELILPVVDTGNNIIQAIGSTITYGRRYEAGNMLGIASEKDDDAAQLPNKNPPPATNIKPPQSTASKPAVVKNAAQLADERINSEIIALGKKHFVKEIEFEGWLTDNNFPQMSKATYVERETILETLKKKPVISGLSTPDLGSAQSGK